MKQEKVTGLSSAEVSERISKSLVNVSAEKITKSNTQIIFDNVMTLFNMLNVLIGICLAVAGAFSNMFFLVVILINIVIGIYQEIHAKKLVENLLILAAGKVTVVRDGEKKEIAAEEIVLDDTLYLGLGDQICTDAKVLSGTIEVNEALLTGEADPITKQPGDSLLSGSYIISGSCYAQAEHVGSDNFAAQLSKGAKKYKHINSELLRSLRKVTKFTSFFIIPVGVLLFLQAYFFRSADFQDSVVSTAAALLGMLPKGLVLLISISLAAGVILLSKKKILVQQMYSLETLAHVDVLCLDKTGTITEGKMKIIEVFSVNETIFQIPFEEAMSRFTYVLSDNNATFSALKERFPANTQKEAVAITAFSSERKWSSASFDDIGTIVVGALDKVLSEQAIAGLPSHITEAQKAGSRLLCVGHTNARIEHAVLPEVSLAAVIVINDSVRKNTQETLAFFKKEGVTVKIISGDNPVTVSAVAKQAGLEEYDSYIDLSKVTSEEELKAAAVQYTIFGRVMPNQKSQLVKALQQEGHTVGMVGDGVNDVMALREADLSAAMAAGSEAAKQVSQLVLLESDFASLTHVIMEGRRVVNNVTRLAGVFFVKTIYSVILAFLCLLVSMPFPFIPIQITLIDLALEGYPSFFLSFERECQQIKGTFLSSVFQSALPKSLLVILNVIAVTVLDKMEVFSSAECATMLYCLTAFVTILAIFKTCYPLTKFRAFLWITSGVGFYVAAYLFSGMLHLAPLTLAAILGLLGMAALNVAVNYLLTRLIDVWYARRAAARKHRV